MISDLEMTTQMARIHAEHQPREHAVSCGLCRSRTWNLSAFCDLCEEVIARIDARRVVEREEVAS